VVLLEKNRKKRIENGENPLEEDDQLLDFALKSLSDLVFNEKKDKWKELTDKLWKFRREKKDLNGALAVLKRQIEQIEEDKEPRANLIAILANEEDLSDEHANLLQQVGQ